MVDNITMSVPALADIGRRFIQRNANKLMHADLDVVTPITTALVGAGVIMARLGAFYIQKRGVGKMPPETVYMFLDKDMHELFEVK